MFNKSLHNLYNSTVLPTSPPQAHDTVMLLHYKADISLALKNKKPTSQLKHIFADVLVLHPVCSYSLMLKSRGLRCRGIALKRKKKD